MRKMICLLLIFCLLLLPGCQPRSEDAYKRPAYFYYPRSEILPEGENAVIDYELREAAQITTRQELLDIYFEGPQSSSFYSPFPEGSSVVDCSFYGKTLYVTLSNHFDELVGMSFTIATSCIAMTLLSSTNINTVEFDVLGEDGTIVRSITVKRDQILLKDTYIELPAE